MTFAQLKTARSDDLAVAVLDLSCPLKIGAKDDGGGSGPALDVAVLPPGTGEHIAQQNQADGQAAQHKQGQQADVAAVRRHGQYNRASIPISSILFPCFFITMTSNRTFVFSVVII